MTTQKSTVDNINQNKRKMRIRNCISGWFFLIPMVIVLYLSIWRPTVIGGLWSFFRMRGYSPCEFVGLQNFKMVVNHTQFLSILINTVSYVLWSLVIGFIPPLIIAIMLNEMVYWKNTLRILIYLPAVIPGIAAMLIWYYIYYPDQTGLLNMLLMQAGMKPYEWLNNAKFVIPGLVVYMTWKGFPGAMLLYYSGVQSAPIELYEAALIDGAGPFTRLWHITLPSLAGIIILNLVSQIISVFQILDVPLAMTGGGPNGASTSLSYQLYQYGFNSGGKAVGQAMALGVIIFLILIVFTLFYFKLNKKIEENY